jgi:cytochrome P450
MAYLRETAPVAKFGRFLGMTVWLVSGYEHTRAVLNDTSHYSNDIRPLLGARAKTSIDGLGFTDTPEHTRLRKILTPEFTGRRLARLVPTIERIVEQRLDEMSGNGDVVDLVAEFAFPIPFLVICELLGLPADDREHFRDLGRARFDLNGGGGGTFGAMSLTRDFLLEAVRRQRTEPGDGLIGAIIRTHGDDIEDVALAGLADGVFTGGYETSASMLALGTLALLQDATALSLVRSDDEALDRIVEELLRHLSVVQISFPRFARHDLKLFGQDVKGGDVVICSLSGANRDRFFGPDPDSVIAGRDPRPHLAFGSGLHRCVGAELARLELRAAFRGYARRFPDSRLAVDPSVLEFRELSIVYGVQSLPVRLHAPAPAAPSWS